MISVPNRYYEFEVAGKVLKCRITTEAIRKLEGRVNKKLQVYLNDLGEDVIGAFVNVLWASQQPFVTADSPFKISDAESVYDALIDEGYDIKYTAEIMKGILRESGLIPKEDELTQMQAEAEEQTEEAEANPNV